MIPVTQLSAQRLRDELEHRGLETDGYFRALIRRLVENGVTQVSEQAPKKDIDTQSRGIQTISSIIQANDATPVEAWGELVSTNVSMIFPQSQVKQKATQGVHDAAFTRATVYDIINVGNDMLIEGVSTRQRAVLVKIVGEDTVHLPMDSHMNYQMTLEAEESCVVTIDTNGKMPIDTCGTLYICNKSKSKNILNFASKFKGVSRTVCICPDEIVVLKCHGIDKNIIACGFTIAPSENIPYIVKSDDEGNYVVNFRDDNFIILQATQNGQIFIDFTENIPELKRITIMIENMTTDRRVYIDGGTQVLNMNELVLEPGQVSTFDVIWKSPFAHKCG